MNTAATRRARERRLAKPALPFLGNAPQLTPRTIRQAMEKWGRHDGPISLARLRPATGAAPEQAMAFSMAPAQLRENRTHP